MKVIKPTLFVSYMAKTISKLMDKYKVTKQEKEQIIEILNFNDENNTH